MLLLATLILLLIPLLFNKLTVLTVSVNNNLERAFFIQNEGSFSIRWIHSVEKEEWEEMFVVEDEEIVLDSTRFKTFGAGVPNDAGDDTFIKDGWVYMTGINQTIGKQLVTRTGKTTEHRFIKGDEVFKLEPSQPYRIAVENINLWHAIEYFIATRMR
ncbi:DUF1850 domain-containing protein [Thalassobacillus devorans]|uniref:DUF1850 domain-containing protein n=1 Tax=Thalassobacillus devorans TaxID=279813 RepID=UPI0006886247|nr:DUF1850 domain-containing protein [Thalassobacillus devorans]